MPLLRLQTRRKHQNSSLNLKLTMEAEGREKTVHVVVDVPKAEKKRVVKRMAKAKKRGPRGRKKRGLRGRKKGEKSRQDAHVK